MSDSHTSNSVRPTRRGLLLAAVALATQPVPTAFAAPRTATGPVRITEGQVAEAAPGQQIFYPSVTSCLTVTLSLGSGAKVGAHASLFQVPGELRSDAILAAAARQAGTRPIIAVEVRGAVGAWHPSYFTRAIESYGDGEPVPIPERPDPDGIARAVAAGLGLRGRVPVTVRDLPDGDQTVN
ncbi:hypothetical protein [Nocardia arthritidis]|uniref:Uncharacterized protein n=1 Tax=Nocardia arthritidis TaxID=228602 RepID=A0A6G9YLM2_9NOCA|nr:hypothetical protein [Nocardia arthritidis]QIS14104.1 hypothetical protein F5544_31310 [Nocardia arthritidis]